MVQKQKAQYVLWQRLLKNGVKWIKNIKQQRLIESEKRKKKCQSLKIKNGVDLRRNFYKENPLDFDSIQIILLLINYIWIKNNKRRKNKSKWRSKKSLQHQNKSCL